MIWKSWKIAPSPWFSGALNIGSACRTHAAPSPKSHITSQNVPDATENYEESRSARPLRIKEARAWKVWDMWLATCLTIKWSRAQHLFEDDFWELRLDVLLDYIHYHIEAWGHKDDWRECMSKLGVAEDLMDKLLIWSSRTLDWLSRRNTQRLPSWELSGVISKTSQSLQQRAKAGDGKSGFHRGARAIELPDHVAGSRRKQTYILLKQGRFKRQDWPTMFSRQSTLWMWTFRHIISFTERSCREVPELHQEEGSSGQHPNAAADADTNAEIAGWTFPIGGYWVCCGTNKCYGLPEDGRVIQGNYVISEIYHSSLDRFSKNMPEGWWWWTSDPLLWESPHFRG